MLNPFVSHADAGNALGLFVTTSMATLPEFTRQKVLEQAFAPSPVDRYRNTIEALYAAKDEIDESARDLGIALAQFCANNGFDDPDRYRAMADAFKRIGGYQAPEGMQWPAAEADPVPRTEYVAPVSQPGI